MVALAAPLAACGGGEDPDALPRDPNSAYGMPALLGLEPIVRPETRVLEPTEASAITSLETLNPEACAPAEPSRVPCEFLITFAALPESVAPGRVLASDVAPHVPYGLLATVTAVDDPGESGTVVHATEATLGDALEQGEFLIEQAFQAADIAGQDLLPGIELDTGVQAAGERGVVSASGSGFALTIKHAELIPGVYADGGVSFSAGCGAYGGVTWKKKFGIPIYPNGVYFEAKCGVEQSGNITVSASYAAAVSKNVRVATFTLTPITFVVGVVPVVLVPTITVDVNVSGSVAVGMSFGASESFGASVGIRYSDGFHPIADYHTDFASHVATGSGRLSASAGVVLGQALLLYGVAGPKLSETLYVNLEGALPGQKPVWCLVGGLKAQGSLVADLGIKKLEWGPETLFNTSAKLGCASNTPPTLAVTEPRDGAEIYPGSTSAPEYFSATAEDAEDGPVAVSWTSDKAGPLGSSASGADFAVPTLAEGTHRITARAVDADGAASTTTFTVVVKPRTPTAVISVKNAAGVWVPVSSLTGALGDVKVVRVTATSPIPTLIPMCPAVTWSSSLPQKKLSECDYQITLSTQGTHALTATVADLDGTTATAPLTVTVGPAPLTATPQMSVVTGLISNPSPLRTDATLADGGLLLGGENVVLSVSYLNYPAAGAAVHYVWTIQTNTPSTTGTWVALPGTDPNPGSGSSRTFAVPLPGERYRTFNISVAMVLDATGATVATSTFTIQYEGPPA